ncbi:MAG: peptide deformylase [Pseudomonadota bacterium]
MTNVDPLSQILIEGDERLRETAAAVDAASPTHQRDVIALADALNAFRAQHGFGRAIAAPQLGIAKRLIVANLGDGCFPIFNPEIVWRSAETFRLWDDCLSVPDVLVEVARHRSISIRFQDETGEWQHWSELAADLSELLQHETDHLDGILMTDRALGDDSIQPRAAVIAAAEAAGPN